LIKITLNSELPVDIEQRVNVIYFKIIILLIEKEPFLHKDILNSLSTFLTLKDDKINCKQEIFRLFELLVSSIKKNQHVEMNNKVFALLLDRIKENYCSEVNKDYTVFFVKNWFYKYHKEQPNIVVSFRKVLEMFINKSFGSTETIVLELLMVLDEVSFEQKNVTKIEDLLLNNP
jgi:hypothetical protein